MNEHAKKPEHSQRSSTRTVSQSKHRLRNQQEISLTKCESTLKKDMINPHTACRISDLVKNVAPKSNLTVHRVDYKQRTGRSVHAKEFVCWKLE